MNDVQQGAAEHTTTDLPLQAQLMGSLALVLVLSAVAGVIGYATFDSSSLENSARAKATMYASNLTQQVYGAVAMGDIAAAEEAIAPLVTDRNVYGVAVYAPGGRRLAGHGNFPVSLTSADEVKLADDRVLLTTRDVPVGDGAPGRLYLALSTEHITSARFRAAQFPAMTTAVVLLFAILLALAHSFSVMMSEVVRMFEERRQMERTEKQRLEKLVSERTRELERGREQYRLVVEGTQAIPFALDVEDGHFEYIGPQGPQRLGFSEDLWKQIGFLDRLMPRDRNGTVRSKIDDSQSGNFEVEDHGAHARREAHRPALGGELRAERKHGPAQGAARHDARRHRPAPPGERAGAGAETGERRSPGRGRGARDQHAGAVRLGQRELRARGHGRSLGDRRQVPRAAQRHAEHRQQHDAQAAAKAAEEAEDDADLDYILENAPVALDRARDGLGRVAAIVRSMKEFAHPDRKEMAQSDLNQAIQSTLVIASNEYKYVADVDTSLGELPLVNCYAGEINQVVLNLIVNAAHAIGDVVKGTDQKGRIRVATRVLDDQVEIAIGDTGKGIPVEVRSRIFDPFFTTKEVGKGTGQGLAIARSVIVEKHGGTLHFETEVGKGTTFYIRLPVNGPASASAAA